MKALLTGTGVALVALLLVAAAPLATERAAQQDPPRIVYIDSERLGREAPGLQAARERMQQEMSRLEAQAEAELGPMQEEFQRLVQEFQQQQAMMTQERRQERQQALQQRQAQIQQRGQEFEQQAATRQNEIIGPALEAVNAALDRLREQRGYAFILDVAGGSVIAADPALDITGDVLQQLQAQANRE